MNTKDLLSQLTRLESTLNDFSFEELTAAEAFRLKKSFQNFRVNLENKIFTPSSTFGSADSIHLQEDSTSKNSADRDIQEPNADKFIARAGNEIGTPLNGIIGFTDLLKEDKFTGKQLERVDAIQTASYSLMEIISELLKYSKISILNTIGALGRTAGIEFLQLIEKKKANFSVRSKAHAGTNAIVPDSIMPSKGLLI